MPSTSSLHLRGAGDFHSPTAQPHHAPDLRLEPSHLEMDVRLDVDSRRANGTVVHTVLARTEGPRELLLDAVGLTVDAVDDPDGHGLSWHYDGERIAVLWDEPVPRGESRRARVEWSVDHPRTGLLFSGPDALYPNAPRWAATDHETERARYWLPCVDHPSVRTTLDIRVRANREFTILGPGLLVGGEDCGDGTRIAHWRLEQPCPSYLLCVAVGDFVRGEGGEVDGREIAFFGPAPATKENLERSFGPTAEMMHWMQKRLGVPFPYPKYFQFACDGIGGAMENISLVSWDGKFVADPLMHAEFGWLIDLVNLHEMAHSYFGDMVVCRDFSETWLKESWATYMESVWLGDVQGQDALDFQVHEERVAYFEEADGRYVRPIVTRTFDSSWDMFDRHLYPGGAVRLHMLRQRLGDADFWSGVTAYLQRHAGGLAETGDFRRAMEEASGQTLTRFFDQWLRSPGYPKLKAGMTWSGERSELTLTIEQTQVNKDTGVGLFDLPMTVALETADGWVRRRLDIKDGRHVLVLALDARPRQIVLDPDGDLVFGLEFKPGDGELARQLTQGPTMAARIQAAVLLGHKPAAKAVATLKACALAEPFWGLRVVIGRALGAAGTAAAADALAEILLAEADPKVMRVLTGAAGSMREASLERALREWLARDDTPYLASQAAFGSLGAQRGDVAGNEAALLAGADDDGFGGHRRIGALRGLGKLRTARGRQVLGERLEYGAAPHNERSVAAEALADSARFGDAGERAEALGRLSALSRDPVYAVRMASTRALATLGEKGGRAALAAVEATVAAQDAPRVRRAGKSLASAGGASSQGKLQGSVEKLQDELRELRKRLETLEGTQKP